MWEQIKKLFNVFLGYGILYIWVALLFVGGFVLTNSSFPLFFSLCIQAPIIEEFLFRHLPYQLGVKKWGIDFKYIILASSIIFGLMHTNGGVLCQGIMGLVFFWVYLKNKESYWSAVLIHSIWNFSVTFLPIYQWIYYYLFYLL